MKVGIDARELSGTPTGVGRYLKNLLLQWSSRGRLNPQDEILLFMDHEPEKMPFRLDPPLRLIILPRWPEFLPGRDTLWQQITLARSLKRFSPDVFFSPAYSLPLRLPCPSVVTVHDISFEAHPHWFPRRQAARRRQMCRSACRKADSVLTVSEFSRQELIKYYRLKPGKVHVASNASEPAFVATEDSAARARLKQKYSIRGRIILHAGTILNRRRISLILDAFAGLLRAEPDLTLVFAGVNRSHPRIEISSLAAGLGIDDRVVLLGYVSDEDLVILYNSAALTVYLSDYEGFGLPPLEALACGSPVITSRGSALEENFKTMAQMYDGREPESLSQLMLDCLRNTARESKESRIERSRQARASFSWEDTAETVLGLLREAARRTSCP